MPFSSCAASLQERLEPMPGDELVRDAVVSSTHAICVAAPPDLVWPWLAQMGAGRAGWYSHDWIDNGGERSADLIVPALQQIGRGDVLPALRGEHDGFVVHDLEPPHRLILVWPSPDGGCTASWTFALRSTPSRDRTRLLVRARLSRAALRGASVSGDREPRAFVERIYRALPHLPVPVVRAMAALGHGFMQTKQLRGIKRRAEARCH